MGQLPKKYPLNLTGTTKQQKASFLDPCYSNKRGALPGPMGHLGDKADLTPSPLRVRQQQGLSDGRNERCCSQLRSCSYRAGFSHPPHTPSKPLQPQKVNGAERNRTAVRDTGVDHLVRQKVDSSILTGMLVYRPTTHGI